MEVATAAASTPPTAAALAVVGAALVGAALAVALVQLGSLKVRDDLPMRTVLVRAAHLGAGFLGLWLLVSAPACEAARAAQSSKATMARGVIVSCNWHCVKRSQGDGGSLQ